MKIEKYFTIEMYPYYYYLRKLYWKKKYIARPYSVFIFPIKLILNIALMSLLQKRLLSNYND